MLVLFFNLGGYRIVIPVLQDQSDRKLETLLDNNEYDDSQLLEVRVALNMPYQQRFTDFERHYGQVEIGGHVYTYVKRKVDGDVVIFKCIANESKQTLRAIQHELTRSNSASDMEQPNGPSKQAPSSFAKLSLGDYDDQQGYPDLTLIQEVNRQILSGYTFFCPLISGNTPHQPPEC